MRRERIWRTVLPQPEQTLFFDGGEAGSPWPEDPTGAAVIGHRPEIQANCTNLEG